MIKELSGYDTVARSRRSFRQEDGSSLPIPSSPSSASLSPRKNNNNNNDKDKGKEKTKDKDEQQDIKASFQEDEWMNKRWPKVIEARKNLLPVEKVASLRESFRLLDDWTQSKKKILAPHLSASAPEKVMRKKIAPKRTLSW